MRNQMCSIAVSVLVWYFTIPVSFAQQSAVPCPPNPDKCTPAPTAQTAVPPSQMQEIYEQVKNPYKYGIILKGENDKIVDCPAVFSHGGKWCMTYIVFDGTGYETWLAQSDNLLQWKTLGRIPTPLRALVGSEKTRSGMRRLGELADASARLVRPKWEPLFARF